MEEIFNSLGRKESWANRFTLSEIMLAWKKVVGSDISRIARPSLLRGKTIFIEVEENVWLSQLQSESKNLKEKLNLILSSKKIKEIKFILSNESTGSSNLPDKKNEIQEEYQPLPIFRKDQDKVNKLIDEIRDQEFKEMAQKLLLKIKKVEGND
tara:strand:- start:196 stop:657 length:462 start_codon:yes stop_codon:yes gene_type:complete